MLFMEKVNPFKPPSNNNKIDVSEGGPCVFLMMFQIYHDSTQNRNSTEHSLIQMESKIHIIGIPYTSFESSEG